jgi:hypothetical protein
MIALRNFTLLVATLSLLSGGYASASTIWSGPRITFEKVGDPELPENQDRITDNVWITRGETSGGIYNALSEDFYINGTSPEDTLWSYGTTADIASLNFQDWRSAVGGNPPSSVGRDMVLWLVTDDIYIDLRFTQWGAFGTGGLFAYERTTPSVVPEPAAWVLATGIVGGLFVLGRRRSRR